MSAFRNLGGRIKSFLTADSPTYQTTGDQTMLHVDEETPLLGDEESAMAAPRDFNDDLHKQFVTLIGLPDKGPGGYSRNIRYPLPGATPLYLRAKKKHIRQSRIYFVTASVNNLLLLAQVVLGAALTGLGASNSAHIWITVFGALNTVIAGVIAYMKSRGQPMRSRMFRDDLERVVDEIENSEIMWLGISRGAHGYDEIDIQDDVSVRSEVARLTRLFDRAVRNNTFNNPDMYNVGNGHGEANLNLRAKPNVPLPPLAAAPREGPAVVLPKPASQDDAKPAGAQDEKKGLPGTDGAADAGAGKAGPASPVPAPAGPPDVASSSSPVQAAPPEGLPLAADVEEGPVTMAKAKSSSQDKVTTKSKNDKGKAAAVS